MVKNKRNYVVYLERPKKPLKAEQEKQLVLAISKMGNHKIATLKNKIKNIEYSKFIVAQTKNKKAAVSYANTLCKICARCSYVVLKQTKAVSVGEKGEFKIRIENINDKKIAAIKAIQKCTGLGLMESKRIIDEAPTTIRFTNAKSRDDLARELKSIGADVTIIKNKRR